MFHAKYLMPIPSCFPHPNATVMGKRAAENQITKDDFEAGKNDGPADEQGEDGFAKAPPEVLKKRRIVKVRRTVEKPAETKPVKNPFGAIAAAANVAAKNPFANLAAGAPAKDAPAKADDPAKEPASEEEKQLDIAKKDLVSENKKDVVEQPKKAVEVDKPAPETEVAKDADKPTDEKPVADDTKSAASPEPKEPAETPEKPTGKANDKPVDTAATKDEGEKKTVQVTTEAKQEAATPEKTTNGVNETKSTTPKSTPFVFGGSAQNAKSFGEVATKQTGGFTFSAATLAASAAAIASDQKSTSFAGVSSKPTAGDKTEYEETKVETGEEGETMVFKVRAKVFALENSAWKERGVGTLKLNADKEGGSARLLLRNEATLRSVLNAPLYKDFKFDVAGERAVRFKCVASGTMYLCRMRTKDDASNLIAQVKKQTEKLKE